VESKNMYRVDSFPSLYEMTWWYERPLGR